MNRLITVALAAASCVVISRTASAAYVTDTYLGIPLATWNQSLNPLSITSQTGEYTVVGISDATGVASGYNYAYYYSAGDFGGLVVGGPLSLINTAGLQIYSGSEAAPMFAPGVYAQADGTQVTITVPEPATWAMMLVGLGMIGFAARSRRNARVTYMK